MGKLSEQEIRKIVIKFYKDTRRDVEESWLKRTFPSKKEFLAEIKTHDDVFSALKDNLYSNQLGDFSIIVEQFLDSQGVRNPPQDSLLFNKLCREFYVASIKATKDTLKQLSEPYADALSCRVS